MTTKHLDSEQLGSYVLQTLEPEERTEFEEHSASCEVCQAELRELKEIQAALGEVPPEAFLEGPPEDGDLLLQRTLRRARNEQATAGRRRMFVVGLGAAAAAGVLFLGGQWTADRGSTSGVAGSRVPSASPTQPAPDVRTVSAKDTHTGASMTVRATPAAGWVRLNAMVAGLPAGERCRLTVISDGGERQIAGHWVVPPSSAKKGAKGTSLDGAASIPQDQLKSVIVENEQGKQYVSVTF